MMKFSRPSADTFVPGKADVGAAMEKITHMGIGAHQDDLEFMAFHGIIACYHHPDEWFGGVICTNGSGSSRTGAYAKFTDEEMCRVRQKEQRTAARIGRYAAAIQLDHPSAVVKDPDCPDLQNDLEQIFRAAKPSVVYTHNPADKHQTHVAVFCAVLKAIRSLPPVDRPSALYGCEVWRDLDWMPDEAKVVQDLSGFDHLAASLNGVFDSQIAGGKRYDLGVIGRRRANATFFESHAIDHSDSVAFAMDLTPLVQDDSLGVTGFVDGLLKRFRESVRFEIQKYF